MENIDVDNLVDEGDDIMDIPAGAGNIDATKTCLICLKDMTLSNSRSVGKKAKATIVDASKRRKDYKFQSMDQLSNCKLHSSCYTQYIRESSIAAASKKMKEYRSAMRESRRSTASFDYEGKCFICERAKAYYVGGVGSKSAIHNIERETINCMREDIELRVANNVQSDGDQMLLFKLEYMKENFDTIKPAYHKKCYNRFFRYKTKNTVGRPIAQNLSKAITFIIDYIVNNEEECQFSLNEILKQYEGDIDDINIRNVKYHLSSHFDNDVVFYHFKGDLHICFRAAYDNQLDDEWYFQKKQNNDQDRMRIVDMAAKIIVQDVRAHHYSTSHYEDPSSLLTSAESKIPPTLFSFINYILHAHKKFKTEISKKKCKNRVLTLSHILIVSIRPQSFTSSILLGLSSLMHRKHASKSLIDCLSNLGLCSSYHETTLFEASIVKKPNNFTVNQDSFVQFIFDNADHNTATKDGRNTFHAMGGIMVVTPLSAVTTSAQIEKLKKLPSASKITESFPFLPITIGNFNLTGLQKIKVKPIAYPNSSISISFLDLSWLLQKNKFPLKTRGWLGFREKYSEVHEFCTSKIIPLQFVNAPTSNENTILSVLIEAMTKARCNGQNYAFVTFDQPLYMKARTIIASVDDDNDVYGIRDVIVRLGGFHTLMSFLGCIGYFMEDSGLKEAFCLLFAELSAEKALSGHAFSQSIRGHLLNLVALSRQIINKCNFTDDELKYIESLNINEELTEINFVDNPICIQILEKFQEQRIKLKENGPTAQLFLQYFDCVVLVMNFYHAERSGNFKLHLESIKQMIPFFIATGHHNYAKSALLYYQDMVSLQSKIGFTAFQQFAIEGYFTVRRSKVFWCGMWTDMVFEQDLMRAMKCVGGMTHGRNITESTIAKWLACSIILFEVCKEMETFCSYSYDSSEQHVDSRISMIKRDALDLNLLFDFYNEHDPFVVSDRVQSIVSGLVGDNRITCHRTFEIGLSMLQNQFDKTFAEISYKRKEQALPLSAMDNKIKINGNIVTVSPLLIFQRITLNITDKTNMKDFLRYELAPYPLSLFDGTGLRKTDKSVFVDNFDCVNECPLTSPITYVVDGRFLLHQISWSVNDNVHDVLNKYVNYVVKRFSKNSFIIFDGYDDENQGTKSLERTRRTNNCCGRELKISDNTKITLKPKEFLSNDANKKQLINLLKERLENANYITKQAKDDADVLIVKTAIDISKCEDNVIIVGNDTDLLVMLCQLADENSKIIFHKVTAGKIKNKFYRCNSFKFPQLKQIISFLYIFTGCDTTSAFFNRGKNFILEKVDHNSLINLASIFYDSSADETILINNGTSIIKSIYVSNADKIEQKKQERDFTLNELRYIHFDRKTSKSTFKLENLPPTEAAAAEHCKRTYLQLQSWLGNDLNPLEYGWHKVENTLEPTYSSEPMIPSEVSEKISCRCQKGCKASCSCRKHGLKCSRLCVFCYGDNCTNVEEMYECDSNNEEYDLSSLIEVIFNEEECDQEEANEPAQKKKRKD